MKSQSRLKVLLASSLATLCLSSFVYAAQYNPPKITNIHADPNGNVHIKWAGSPRPGPCPGENNGWVKIQATADKSMKALALAIYLHGLPARIDTAGCDAGYEIVVSLYSPGG